MKRMTMRRQKMLKMMRKMTKKTIESLILIKNNFGFVQKEREREKIYGNLCLCFKLAAYNTNFSFVAFAFK